MRQDHLELPLPYQIVKEKSRAVLRSLPRLADLREETGGWRTSFMASTSANWRSFGENVRMDVSGDDVHAAVDVESWCSIPTTVVDWGQNRLNVKFLTSRLKLPVHDSHE
jgi:hypothetical protein